MEKSLHIYIYIIRNWVSVYKKSKKIIFVFLKFIEQKRYITIGTIIFVIHGCANIKYNYRLLVMSVFIERKI